MLEVLDSGEYNPGARLPSERELSERFGVSRPTIREAIIALEINGRVEVKTGSGVYVLDYKPTSKIGQDISPFELTETRVLLEAEAAALTASMITEEELDELASALQEMEHENNIGDLISGDADRKFHSIISNATQNRALINLIELLWNMQENLPEIHAAHQSVCKTDGKRRYAEHKAIYDALAKHDSHMARIAMRNHFSPLIEALHSTTEAKAVEKVQREVNERRERFSINRLSDSFHKET